VETRDIVLGDARWTVYPESEGWLRAEFPVWTSQRGASGLTRVTDKRFRRVTRVDRGGPGTVYLKWSRPRAWYDHLRNRLWPSRLAVEWRRLHQLRRLGVAAAAPVAYGQRRSRGMLREEWLITVAVDGPTLAQHANGQLAPGPGIPAALAGEQAPRTVGVWLRRLHELGVEHPDLHANNVIVRDADVPLTLIDVDDVTFRRGPLPAARRVAGLARLLGRGDLFTPEARSALVEAYAAAGPEPMADPRLLERVEATRHRQAWRHRRNLLRRALRSTSSRFRDHRGSGWRLRVRAEVGSALAEGLLDQAAQRMAGGGGAAPGGASTVEAVWERLPAGSAARAFRGALALELWAVGGPRLVGLLRPRSGGDAADGAILTEPADATPWADAVSRAVAAGAGPTCELAERTGRWLAALHLAGLSIRGGVRAGDLEVLASPASVRLRPSACARVRWRRQPSPAAARRAVARLARELADLAGDGAGDKLDVAYRRTYGRRRPAPVPPRLPDAPRIAIVKIGAIGDVVNTLPLAVQLRDRFPEGRTAWVVGPAARPFLEGHPAVDEIIDFPRRNYARLPGCIRKLRAFRPDVVIDAGRQIKSGLAALASGAPVRLGFDRERAKERSWIGTNWKTPPALGRGLVLEHYLELGHALGCPEAPPRWDLAIPEAARRRAAALLAGAAEPVVAITVGATKEANLWPPQRLARIARHVCDRGGTPVLVGGPAERRRGELVALLAGRGVRDLTGCTSLMELAAVLERCRVVVAHDTGPLHIAVAVGATSLPVFGAADPLRTGPWGQLDAVRRVELPCAPCRKRACPLGTRACMGLLEEGAVLPALDALLAGRRPAPAPVPTPELRHDERRVGPWQLLWDRDRPPGTLTERLDRLPELFEQGRVTIYNDCATAVTARWDDPEAGALFVKRYRDRHTLDAWKNLVRRSRARRAWDAGRRLVAMGVITGRPVALALRKQGGRVTDAFVVAEEVPHEGSVLEVFRDRRADAWERARLVRAAALHLRDIHDRMIYPHDMKGTNLLVCERDGVLAFGHIDLDRQRFDRPVTERDAIRNLVYLDTSFGDLHARTDRLRFLRAYLGERYADRAAVRRIVEAVLAGVAERRPRRRPPLEPRPVTASAGP
jgi:ADP-heptose:LPS heptosyltransferase/tRNA A-37 threonylcarbamoyl transferase component Bud32